jgi:hypothetical protein
VSSRGTDLNVNCFGHLCAIAALAAALAGCGDDTLETTIAYRLHGPPPTGLDGRCTEPSDPTPVLTEPDSIRLTYRYSNGGLLVCDAVLDASVPNQVVAVPVSTTSTFIDVFAELYKGGALVGTGVSRRVDLNTPAEVRVFVTPVDEFACAPERASRPRAFHAVAVLPDGSALITGGIGATDGTSFFVTGEVELYANGDFRPVSVPGLSPRALHSAIVLDDDGSGSVRIALVGGVTVAGDAATTPAFDAPMDLVPFRLRAAAGAVGAPTEILTFDPDTGTATVAAVGLGDVTPRLFAAVMRERGQTATMLAGGWIDAARTTPEQTAQTIDPTTGGLGVEAAMLAPRYGATLTELSPARAMIWGGHIDADDLTRGDVVGEVVQLGAVPVSEALAFPDPTMPPASRAFHAAARSHDDELIVAGGFAVTLGNASAPVTPYVERIRYASITSYTAPLVDGNPPVPAGYPDALRLTGGDVLVTGGNADLPGCAGLPPLQCSTGQAYRYRVSDEQLAEQAPMVLPRYGHRGAQLATGDVLITGGLHATADELTPVADAELFNPAAQDYDPIADLGLGRAPGETVQPCTVLIAPAQ